MPPTATRRYKGRTASQRAEQVAAWVLDEWAARRRLGYKEMRSAIMDRFDCGQQLAEQAIKVARELLHERASDASTRDKVADAYWDLYDSMVAKGDERGAVRVLDSIVEMFGLAEPDKVTVTQVTIDLDKMTDEELAREAGMTKGVLERAAERAAAVTGNKNTGN